MRIMGTHVSVLEYFLYGEEISRILLNICGSADIPWALCFLGPIWKVWDKTDWNLSSWLRSSCIFSSFSSNCFCKLLILSSLNKSNVCSSCKLPIACRVTVVCSIYLVWSSRHQMQGWMELIANGISRSVTQRCGKLMESQKKPVTGCDHDLNRSSYNEILWLHSCTFSRALFNPSWQKPHGSTCMSEIIRGDNATYQQTSMYI